MATAARKVRQTIQYPENTAVPNPECAYSEPILSRKGKVSFFPAQPKTTLPSPQTADVMNVGSAARRGPTGMPAKVAARWGADHEDEMTLKVAYGDDSSRALEKYDKALLLYFFYDKHNPDKISNVPKICKDYEGDEETLMNSLLLKYQLDDEEWVEIVKDMDASPGKVKR